MKKIDQYRTTLRVFTITIFSILSTFIYFLVWDIMYNPKFESPYIGKGKIFIVVVYFIVLLVANLFLDSHKVDQLRRGEIIFYGLVALVFANAIAYAQICLIIADLANIVGMIYIIILQSVWLVAWTCIAAAIAHKMSPPEKMLIIYGSHLATEIVYNMSQMEDRYVIVESANVDEGYDKLSRRIEKFDGVIICDVPARLRNDLLKFCYQQNKAIYVIPKISDIIIRSASNITYFDSPIMKCQSTGLSVEQRAVKRFFDVVICSIAMVVASPVFLAIALAIKLYDGGPVFYKQRRCSLDLKPFDILKFRSMIVDAEKNGPQPAVDGDKRITPVGKVIRALRIDELPQLINIIKGDMSIVGPRPERIEHVEKYSAEIPEFVFRYKVKGGLTGYAQVFGKYNTSAYNKLKMDLMYIQNYSLALDFKLILMTIKILFKRESTEGFKVKSKKDND